MKRFLLMMTLPVISFAGFAQNSAHYKSQTLMREKKYDKAIELCQSALQNPKTTKKAEISRDLAMAYTDLFNVELVKAAANTPFDTTAFCNNLDEAVQAYTQSDVYDKTPNKKGKVKSKLIEQNRASLAQMVDYYNYAALLEAQRGNNAKAVSYFEKYLDFPNNAAFTPEQKQAMLEKNQESYTSAAINIMRLSYGAKDWDKILQVAQKCTPKDSVNIHDYYVMIIGASQMKEDTILIEDALQKAVANTGDDNFIGQLINFYMRRQERDKAIEVANELIKRNPDNKKNYYIKGVIEMNMPPYNYEDARKCLAKALELDPNYKEAIKNMGVCWVNDIVDLIQSGKKRNPEEYEPYFEAARPYFEKLQEMYPDEPAEWAAGLYQVYLNLGLEKEAQAIKPYTE